MILIKIVTDSGSDLSIELAKENNIEVIPIPVQLGDKEYKDRVNLAPADFYTWLEENDKLAITSRISPYEFKEKFTELLNDYDKIIYISFSSQLSGIYESALLAQEMLNSTQVKVIDSKAASLGQGLIVLKAARLAAQMKDEAEIITELQDMIDNLEHVFGVGSLEMLKRGGRISTTKAYLGSLLNIKPILQITKDGRIIPLSKVRGEKRFFKYMLDIMQERGVDLSNQIIGIGHGREYDKAKKLAAMIKKEYNVQEVIITEIGAAIGAHVGAGTVLLCFQ